MQLKLKTLVTAVVAAAMLAFAGTASASPSDRDGDKMPDRWEKRHGLSAKKSNAKADADRDGLSNRGEFIVKSDPKDAFTDADRIDDGDEDEDEDGLDNEDEEDLGTNLTDADSDDDGVEDGDEDKDGDSVDNEDEDDVPGLVDNEDEDDELEEEDDEVTTTSTTTSGPSTRRESDDD